MRRVVRDIKNLLARQLAFGAGFIDVNRSRGSAHPHRFEYLALMAEFQMDFFRVRLNVNRVAVQRKIPLGLDMSKVAPRCGQRNGERSGGVGYRGSGEGG